MALEPRRDEWNEDAGFDNYPAIILRDTTIDSVDSASLSLDPEYLGDEGMRTVFMGLTLVEDGSGQRLQIVAFQGSEVALADSRLPGDLVERNLPALALPS